MGDGYLSEGKRKQVMDRAAQAILERQRRTAHLDGSRRPDV
ncbi:MAG: hypothetical protein ACUVR7_15355 [Armatimonadota bacterium]